jgi:WD40 repeat protein
LIRDEHATPFNVGRRIELTDFTDAEAAPLALGLGRTGPLGEALLKRALYWTGGHPYLTQRLCQAVAEESRAVDPAGVDRLCEATFLCPRAQERDDNLLFVREQLLRGEVDPARLLLLYAQVRSGKPVRDDERSPFVRALRLSGIVRPVDGTLAVRNRIYARVFDPQWVAEHAPSVDLWGQRAACRRAAARALSERERQEALRGLELISSKHLERGARLLREGDSLGLLELLEARRLGGSARPSGEARSDLWCSSLGASTGRLRGVIGHEGPVFAAAFSPDAKLLATASADETARLWLAADGTPHGPPLPHQAAVVAVAFSPDGTLLATGSLDGTARLWKTATGQPYGHVLRHEGRVQAVAFSPDGTLLATGASDGTARLWQVGAGRLHDLPLRHQDEVRAVAFGANGRLLATASADRTARLWLTATGEPHGRPLRHLDAVGDVVFDRAGRLVATASVDGTARLWEAATGEPRGQPLRHRARITALAFSPDGAALATGSEDMTAQLWETASGTPLGPPLPHPGHVTTVAFHPDGTLLATGSTDGAARLWHAATGELQGPPLQHQGSITRVELSPDGGRLVTASWDGTARLWATSRSPSPVLSPSRPNADRAALPAGMREMELRTWVTVGARLTAQGTVEAIPWHEWQGLREELRALEARPAGQ